MEDVEKEHISNLLLLSFIQTCTHHSFHVKLEAMAQGLGLQTSVNENAMLLYGPSQPWVTRAAVVRLGAALARCRESVLSTVDLGPMNEVAEILVNPILSESDRIQCLDARLQRILVHGPEHHRNERVLLILTMHMAKMLAEYMPDLLPKIFQLFGKLTQKRFPCVETLIPNNEMH
ncbi:BH3-interacting domain death agonist-like [Fukomys damarensis]|uniref:BH3-interacting domain death agonist-like n=1 Tax=Fukomys damarensis TaxID=885580 RepID=UPI0005401A2E|nr:BH3-interacting domain death agonist-like [Fukomys damarensis]